METGEIFTRHREVRYTVAAYVFRQEQFYMYSPRNDPQVDPEMTPTFLLVDPEMIPRNYGMVIKHVTGDCFFVFMSFQIKGNYLLDHCLVSVSPQSTFDLFSLMCNVSNRVD